MRLVLDTNIVLDLLVFRDPATAELGQDLASGMFEWLATAPMRDELERVLAYPKLAPRVAHARGGAQAVLADFDRLAVGLTPDRKLELVGGRGHRGGQDISRIWPRNGASQPGLTAANRSLT